VLFVTFEFVGVSFMVEPLKSMKWQLDATELLTIGQLTKAVIELTGINTTASMIYNYEKNGLVQTSERTEGGFRLFDIQQVKQVACIKLLQLEGFSLDEIGDRINQCDLDLDQFNLMLPELESQRTKILKAAMEIFPRKGFSGTNLSDIAQEAGVSSSALYRYFDSKHDLFIALIDNFSFRDVLEQINEGIKRKELSTKEEVRRSLIMVGQAFLNAHTENKEFHRMFLAESGNYPDIGRVYSQRMIAPIMEMFREFISYQIQIGLFVDVDPRIASFSFFGNFLIIHSSQNLLHGKNILPLPEEQIVEKLVDLYLDGLLA
jgi:AcrR family transcriptional regulator